MDKDWKREERVVSKSLGGTRSRVKTGPDSTDVEVALEVKLQGKLALLGKDIQQAKEHSRKTGKPWVLSLRQKKTKSRYAIVDWEFLKELYYAKYGTDS